MPTDFEELKRQFLQNDEEFRQLATQHHDLDEQIHDLTSRHYLSNPNRSKKPRSRNASCTERSDGDHPAPAQSSAARCRARGARLIRRSALVPGQSSTGQASACGRLALCCFVVSRGNLLAADEHRSRRVPFIAAALVPAAALAAARRTAWPASFAAARRVLRLFLPRSRPAGPADAGRRRLAGGRPGHDGRPGRRRRVAAGRRGSRSRSSCRRWTSTSTASPVGGRVTRIDYRPGRSCRRTTHAPARTS